MEITLPIHQQSALHKLADQTGRSTDDLVSEAIGRMLAQQEWFHAQVQIGIDQIAHGEFLEEEEMDARVEEMLRR